MGLHWQGLHQDWVWGWGYGQVAAPPPPPSNCYFPATLPPDPAGAGPSVLLNKEYTLIYTMDYYYANIHVIII